MKTAPTIRPASRVCFFELWFFVENAAVVLLVFRKTLHPISTGFNASYLHPWDIWVWLF